MAPLRRRLAVRSMTPKRVRWNATRIGCLPISDIMSSTLENTLSADIVHGVITNNVLPSYLLVVVSSIAADDAARA